MTKQQKKKLNDKKRKLIKQINSKFEQNGVSEEASSEVAK